MSEKTEVNVPTIRTVAAGNGWLWVKNGYQLFKAYPLMWVIIFMIYFALIIPLSSIPVIGPIVSTLIAPVFAAGMMLGCRAVEQGGELEINHLFAGFKKNTAQLVSLGGFYMLGILMVSMLFASGFDPSMVESISKGGTVTPAQMTAFSGPLLLASILLLPVMMAYWFAPVLVALHNLSAIQALKLSLRASLTNTMAFLMYGFVFAVMMLVMAALFSVLGQLGVVVALLALCFIVPLMMTSLYTSYRDIFQAAQTDKK